MAARTSGEVKMTFFKMIFDRMCSPVKKNSLHYLMSVAKQMLVIGHCYSGLVTVVIAATAIRMRAFI